MTYSAHVYLAEHEITDSAGAIARLNTEITQDLDRLVGRAYDPFKIIRPGIVNFIYTSVPAIRDLTRHSLWATGFAIDIGDKVEFICDQDMSDPLVLYINDNCCDELPKGSMLQTTVGSGKLVSPDAIWKALQDVAKG